ncbi:PdxA family dehydrogenase [Roseomonas xinghualingensis]|uniref:PdxA family dehydrogenase n=1 Tax=Roseomonas xinghualingensis TaxID=2986475 RepID=UPI0021F24A21|nr:4-hydroxythreonine-4-phosphate dehydrogenase PdxA [Roseomonas sp. SXEYE001]MCV4210232.1 4-hydroxythreonine-4-phosphate dehydrogenase PdxA [Roseomonas sp. SXEYE001]
MSAAPRRRIALTIGDPNGIGPEIAVKAAALAARRPDGPVPVLVGDPVPVRHYAARHAADLPIREAPAAWQDRGGLNLAPLEALPEGAFRPGKVTPEAGAATVAYVREALALLDAGEAAAIIGCPHSETAVAAAGIPFSGYPGLVADLTGVPHDEVFMMLVGGGLRIVHATLHERLQTALERVTPELVAAAGQAAHRVLTAWGVPDPRIGVFGLNPHAGEGGLFGIEDARVTEPAVAALRQAGIRAEGPAGADVLLASRAMDAYVAIYHDQGHIPIKLLAPRRASALSIGAKVLFSSVGHGSAFDIAGQGVADPGAVTATLELLHGGKGAHDLSPRPPVP